jgi:glucuronate isomerase
MKKSKILYESLLREIKQTPKLDIHTHVKPAAPQARSLYEMMGYHFVTADLDCAGMPEEAVTKNNLTDYERVAKMIPYFKYCRNTGTYLCLEAILKDLYRIEDPLGANWKKSFAAVERSAKDANWANKVLKEHCKLEHVVVDYAERDTKPVLDMSFASYTLERGALSFRANTVEQIWDFVKNKYVGSAAELRQTVRDYVTKSMPACVKSVTTGVEADFFFPEVHDSEIDSFTLKTRSNEISMEIWWGSNQSANLSNRLKMLSFIFHEAMKVYAERGLKVILAIGARAIHFNNKSFTCHTADTAQRLGEIAFRYKGAQFFIINCSRALAHELTILSKMLPNLCLAGYWWHGMYPEYVGQALAEKLDIIPYNKILGFFSDAYMAEWVYGKLTLVQKETARILADKVERGYYSEDLAGDIIRKIFYENPKRLYLGK